MRSIIVGGIAAAVLTFALAGCASAGSAPDAPVSPGASDSPTAPAAPVGTGDDAREKLADLPMPSATEPVLAIGTVLEQDGAPTLCVGFVAESAPPQCAGMELIGWDWAAFEHQDSGGVRWTQGVAIEGTYDAAAQTFTATGEPMSAAAIQLPAIETPQGDLDEATVSAIQDDLEPLMLERPDILGSWSENGTLVLNVTYDDGSVQAALDDIYGTGVAFVVPALR
ncbi:hypothetical protein [Agrococcus sp. DT81.2]|uniref:hypothetical protein n=1 Tax=Agrococcus sp. DT81.2 TaxID=3393414 RepID=UPI003CE5BE71